RRVTMSFVLRLFPLLVLASAPALAQYPPDPYQDQDYDQPDYDQYAAPVVPENVSYGYAQVLRADEVTEIVRTRTPEERCEAVEYRQTGQTTTGTVVGALVGAALGNQVGKGNGRKAATV